MGALRLAIALLMALMLSRLAACTGGGTGGAPIQPGAQEPAAGEAAIRGPAAGDHGAAPGAGAQEPSLGAQEPARGEAVVSFDYEKQPGMASNQFAVWVEDMDGKLVKTLYATKFTANGGYKNRPDSIAAWVEKSGLASMAQAEVDAVTGATPKAGALSYAWDLTDNKGGPAPTGTYRFYVEGTLRWKNSVLYKGQIDIFSSPTTANAKADYKYEASEKAAALDGNSPENNMITNVVVSYSP